MIEKTVLDYLERVLPYPVYAEFPEKPEGQFYVIRKADSGRDNYIDDAMFTVRSYGKSLLESAQMNELAKTAMDNLTDLDVVTASVRAGDYPMPDIKDKRYCYQTIHNITHY